MDGYGIALVLMVITFVIGLVTINNQNEAKAKELQGAEAANRLSLTALKASPTNANLKESTLRKGRAYSNLTRNRQGVTMYDEMALMNDINAACAGVGVSQLEKHSDLDSIEGRLSKLQQLRERNLITEQEYEQRRAEILREL